MVLHCTEVKCQAISAHLPSTAEMTSYEALAARTENQLAKQLLSIIISKKTNLCVSIDVTSPDELLSIVRKVGQHVSMVKVCLGAIPNC